MGQYFYFYNQTRKENNKKPSSWNGGLHWVKGLNSYFSPKQIHLIFEEIISKNNWCSDDKIVAYGDYEDSVDWDDYKSYSDSAADSAAESEEKSKVNSEAESEANSETESEANSESG